MDARRVPRRADSGHRVHGSAAKAAAFAALLRVFVVMLRVQQSDWRPIIYALAVLTLVVGAVLAIVQTDVKRMLAYSSISHAGFMLVGVQAASDDGIAAVLFYAMAYTFMVLGTFGVVTLVAGEETRPRSWRPSVACRGASRCWRCASRCCSWLRPGSP